MIRVLRAIAVAGSVLAGVAPASARLVYVPAINLGLNEGTEIVLYNDGGKVATYRYAVNPKIGPANGPSGSISPAGHAVIKVTPESGIVALEVSDAVQVGAWLRNRVDGRAFFAGMPTVPSGGGVKANAVAEIYHAHVGIGRLWVLNLGNAETRCTVDSTLIDLELTVPPGELGSLDAVATARFDEALEVRCNQPFLPFVEITDLDRTRISNVAQSPPNEPAGLDEAEFFDEADAAWEWLGMFHQPSPNCSTGIKKGFFVFPLEKAEAAVRTRARIDQRLGTFWSKNKSGVHNFFWLHRNFPSQPYRENNLGNVNALGTGKNRFRVNQNIDMPKGDVTKADGGFKWVTNSRYLIAYEHDPVKKEMRLQLSQKGDILVNLLAKATGFEKEVKLPAGGVVVEFGNRCGDPPPEVPQNSDWFAHDFKIGLELKP